ncbi:winged helix-turn-helix transcriptional regulator [Nocardia thailandica]|uniref:winged helix-turn-helix transcriptional regulator n=1 Tax=Nocardia thailandica TaxID=257275 RepID=UPI0005BB0241|nr:helix-turn-helix domain-containing protein [Nocardia thailandica]
MRSATDASGDADPVRVPPTALDLFGQRWMLRIIWELIPGPLGFLQLRRQMGNCSSSMLSDRLQQLQTAGIVTKHGPRGSYELTSPGHGLAAALQPLWDWSSGLGAADG